MNKTFKNVASLLSFAAIGIAASLYFGADATAAPITLDNSILANPFKSGPVAQTAPSEKSALPWTSTTNPTTNPRIYLGMPVIVAYQGGAGYSFAQPQVGFIAGLDTLGNVGSTPMREHIAFLSAGPQYAAWPSLSCTLFQTEAQARAAVMYAKPWLASGQADIGAVCPMCVAWPNQDLL